MASKYLIANGGNWTDTTKWAASDADAATNTNSSSTPTAADDVFLTANSGQCTISAASVGKSLTCTGYTNTLTHNAFGLTISGSVTLVSGMTYTPTNNASCILTMQTASSTLTTGGKLMPSITLNSAITVQLGDNLNFMDSKILVMQMTGNQLDMNGKSINGFSVTSRPLLRSNALGTSRTINNATTSFTNMDFRDLTFSSASSLDLSAITGNSGDCGGNTITGGGSTLTFTTGATQTLTMSTAKSYSDATIWSGRVPLPQDSINASGWTAGTLTLDMPRLGKNIDFSAATNGVAIAAVTIGLTSYGDVNLTKIGSLGSFGAGGTGSWTMESMARTGTIYLTTNGRSFGGTGNRSAPLIIASTGATTEFLDAVSTGGNSGSQDQWSISGGGVTFGSFTYTITRYTISSTTLNLNGATITANIAFTFTGTTVNPGTSTISFATSTAAQSFSGGGKTYNNLNVVSGTGALTTGGSNTYNTFTINAPKTVILTNTQTVSDFVATGTAGNLITLASQTLTTTPPILSTTNGYMNCQYVDIQGVNVTPAGRWFSGNKKAHLGLDFGGQAATGDYVSAADSATGNRSFGATSFSGEAWAVIRSVGGNSGGRFFDKGLLSTVGWGFFVTTGNVVGITFGEGAGLIGNQTSTTYTSNALTHFVFSWTSGEYAKVYINGSLATTPVQSIVTTPNDDSAQTLNIGNASARTRTFDGQIYVARLYRNVALSAANVTTLYNSGVMTKTSNPLGNATAEYLFHEGTGSTLTDSISAVNGTITGADWANTGWRDGSSMDMFRSLY